MRDELRSEPRRLMWVRAAVQRLTLWPVLSLFCRPLVVEGRANLAGPGPFVFVANHSSHADTALILRALPASLRRKTSPAAAEDYFFKTKARAWMVRLLVGAFPFPRHGRLGLRRARALLAQGRSVILFPEGTRSTDGRVHDFRCGAASLACGSTTLVPVAITGAGDVLPKGTRFPRRAGVVVRFGAPIRPPADADPRTVSDDLRERVVAMLGERPERERWHARAGRFARSRAALALGFAWGWCEALFFPIVPDLYLAPLAMAAPRRTVPLVLSATAGSVLGGAVAHSLGPGWSSPLLAGAPLVTPRMIASAEMWLDDLGPRGLLRQPLSGIPYKVFALSSRDLGSVPFVGYSLLARGARLAAVGGLFACGGMAFARWWDRFFVPFVVVGLALFAYGLVATYGSWS